MMAFVNIEIVCYQERQSIDTTSEGCITTLAEYS